MENEEAETKPDGEGDTSFVPITPTKQNNALFHSRRVKRPSSLALSPHNTSSNHHRDRHFNGGGDLDDAP